MRIFGEEIGKFQAKTGVRQGKNAGCRVTITKFHPKNVAQHPNYGHKQRKSNKGGDSGLFYDDPSSPQPTRRKMAKVKLSLSRLGPDEVVDLANTIKTAMTGNANFTTPNPTLASLGTLVTTAQTKINAYNTAKATADTALSDRDTAAAALRAGLTQEGDYVQNITNGDQTKIESAGMSVRDDAAPIGPPTQVLDLVVTAGDNDGTLDASWDPVCGATGYEVQTSVDPITGSSWTFKQTASKSSVTITGLTSATKIWVRVRAVGSGNTTGPWSDPATKVVP
jgi:hypothetical protein